MSKLRLGQSFALSWTDDASIGGGRTTIWIHPHADLVFKYDGSGRTRVNPRWIHALTATANSPTGLHIVPEPPEQDDGDDRDQS